MKINVERIRKRESSAVLDFEYEIEETAKDEFKALLSAETLDYVEIAGEIKQDANGFALIEYAICAVFTAECARCGCETPKTTEFSGVKYLAGKTEGKEENDDYYTLEQADIIDLREFLAEFLALEVPIRYLCSEDCKGLCQSCGKDLNAGECGCPKQGKNPAFKILDNLFD